MSNPSYFLDTAPRPGWRFPARVLRRAGPPGQLKAMFSRSRTKNNRLWARPNAPQQDFSPPNTWNAHRSCPSSCECNREWRPDMDPLVAAAYHNRKCSRLHKIPEELLLMIINHLDISSIQCLREVSRLFLRVYCSEHFNSTKSEYLKWIAYAHRLPGHYWLQPPLASLPPKLYQEHTRCVARDIEGFYKDCRSKRMQDSWGEQMTNLTGQRCALFCSGCEAYHPRALFSKEQRSTSGERICIGREGHVRLCSHKVITWDEVSDWVVQMAQPQTPHHYVPPAIGLLHCDHESHLPQNHGSSATSDLALRPRFSVRRRILGTTVYVVLEWEGHLQVDNPEGTSMSPTALHRQLQPFRESVAQYIAPEMAPGRLPEMGCLDPNRCDCLFLKGKEVLRGYHLASAERIVPKSCRLNPQCRLDALRPASTTSTKQEASSLASSENAHRTVIQTTSTLTGKSLVSISIDPCSHERCLSVKYSRSIAVAKSEQSPGPGCVTMAWCQALDPESYKLMDDEESFGVYWCRTPGCLNYHGYGRKACVNPYVASLRYRGNAASRMVH